MLSFGFRIFCWYRGFCHRTGSDLLLFLLVVLYLYILFFNVDLIIFLTIGSVHPNGGCTIL